MYRRALDGMETAWDSEYRFALDTANDLRLLNGSARKNAKVQNLHPQALDGDGQALSANQHPRLSPLRTKAALKRFKASLRRPKS